MAGLLLPHGALLRENDAERLAARVRQGDVDTGWRGDPSMDVYVRESQAAVYGFDRNGDRYLAAVVNISHSGWREELLAKLRDGDWQTDEPINAKVKEANAQRQAELDAQDAEAAGAAAEHMEWAIRQDAGQHLGGRRKIWTMGV